MNLPDLTVDTNVLMHCSNPTQPEFDAARDLALALLSASTYLCFDEGFDIDEAKNRSRIGSEYLNHLVPGDLGYQVVVAAASSGRVMHLVTSLSPQSRKIVNRSVADRTDRVFVIVAAKSQSKTLVSHDLSAFPDTAKAVVLREFGLSILLASEV